MSTLSSTAVYSTALAAATAITHMGLAIPAESSTSAQIGFLATAKTIMKTVSDESEFTDGHAILTPGTATVGESRIY